VVGEKLTNEECSVSGRIVVVENPILRAPQIRSLSQNVLPQTPQNFAVKLCVDGVPLWDEFAMNCVVVYGSWDSSVGIAADCRLDDRGVGVKVPVVSTISLLYIVQTGPGTPQTHIQWVRCGFSLG
jgi:hypothetical protein